MTRAHPTGIFVALPVLNEAANIDPLLDDIELALAGETFLVCVVDDGSRDGTLEKLDARLQRDDTHLFVIRQMKTQRGSQRGGALITALRYGIEHTACDVFVEMDGDRSHRPEELRAGIDAIRRSEADVVIASKFVAGSKVIARPLSRRLVSQLCSGAVHLLLSSTVKDWSNGYRFYSRSAAAIVYSSRIRYTSPIYLSEVLALWLHRGLRVIEKPTTYIGRDEGLSKLRPIDLVKAGIAVFEIAVRYRFMGFGSSHAIPRSLAPDE